MLFGYSKTSALLALLFHNNSLVVQCILSHNDYHVKKSEELSLGVIVAMEITDYDSTYKRWQ